jgi:hypothetical protein
MEDEPRAEAPPAEPTAPALSVGLGQLLELMRATPGKKPEARALGLELTSQDLSTGERCQALIEKDALGLRALCAGVIQGRYLLLAPERLFWQAAAVLALEISLGRHKRKLERLLVECMERALDFLLSADVLAELEGEAIDPDEQEWFEIGRELFLVPAAQARLCLLRFNQLETPDRRFLFARLRAGLQQGARTPGDLLGIGLETDPKSGPLDFARARVQNLLERITIRGEQAP